MAGAAPSALFRATEVAGAHRVMGVVAGGAIHHVAGPEGVVGGGDGVAQLRVLFQRVLLVTAPANGGHLLIRRKANPFMANRAKVKELLLLMLTQAVVLMTPLTIIGGKFMATFTKCLAHLVELRPISGKAWFELKSLRTLPPRYNDLPTKGYPLVVDPILLKAAVLYGLAVDGVAGLAVGADHTPNGLAIG